MKKLLLAVLIVSMASIANAKDDKSEQKNKKAVAKEEARFEKSLQKDPNSALPYLEHANNLSAINSESGRAAGFYKLALKKDTANADIYRDFGVYLADKQHAFIESKEIILKGLALAPGDEVMKKYLKSLNEMLALQEADNKLRDFGTSQIKELNPAGEYPGSNQFDSLRIVTTLSSSKFYYPDLIARFLSDDKTLNPQEMYMLLLGFSIRKTYNPFNYNDVKEVKMLAAYNIDSAISKGKLVIETNPLNPSLNREMMYFFRKKGDAAEAERYLNRVKQFFNGVLYSGNGTCDKPYIALWSKEEYNFITYLGYKSSETHYMSSCAGQMAEVIEVTDLSTKKPESIHFNVAPIYMQSIGK
jgi:hypothetical protein